MTVETAVELTLLLVVVVVLCKCVTYDMERDWNKKQESTGNDAD